MGLRPSSLGVATRVGGGVHFQYIYILYIHWAVGGRVAGSMSAPGCAMQTCITLAHRRPTNKTRPASYFAPEASRPPPCNVFIASSRCLIIRSTHGVDLSSLDVPHPANSATCDPASWARWPKLDLRDNGTPIDQAPPPSHNRRSCRSRSRTRKSLRGRIY
jgi:hypothetical protein